MTVKEVKKRVSAIKIKGILERDDEAAHSMEDDLHQDVLKAISEGQADFPSLIAKEALKTLKFDFSRWCA